jgi:dienelactone hydrolase
LIQKLKDDNVQDYSFIRHDNADHAFTNQDYHNHDRYNAEAAAASFKAVFEFFGKNL